MKTKHILAPLIFIIFLSLTSCKKYPNGPAFSLLTKKERVSNNWKVAQAFDNGTEVTSDYNKYELNLTKSGNASLSAKYSIFGTNFEYVTNGKWLFVSEKEKLSFDFDNNDADKVYKILKLEEEEMWIKEDAGSLELHLVTQ